MNPIMSIIIPNFNGLEHLRICLPSLRNQTFKNFEIILMDNGSTDESIDYVATQFPEIRVLRLSKNFGFPKAINFGIKKSQGKYILILNNDTEIDKDCIKYLVDSAKIHRECGFISAKILNFNNRNIVDNAGDYMDSSGHLLTRGIGQNENLYTKGEYIFLGTGSGTLFKREVFKKIGLFDEDFFFYMEDADFCFRAQLAGFKGWFEPKAIIYHKRMGTSKKYIKNYESLVFRNMTMTLIKNFPRSLLLLNFNWLKIILVHINTLKYLILKGFFLDGLKVELFLLANFVQLLKKRKKVQALKVVSDNYINSQIKDKKFMVGKLLFL